MNHKTLEPDHIEDYLITVRTGQWFTWSDPKNKVYANLRLPEKVWNSDATELIDNPLTELPTEEEVNAGFKAMHDKSAATQYQRSRQKEYPNWGIQLDYIYHNGIEKWKTDLVDPVKAKYPKPT